MEIRSSLLFDVSRVEGGGISTPFFRRSESTRHHHSFQVLPTMMKCTTIFTLCTILPLFVIKSISAVCDSVFHDDLGGNRFEIGPRVGDNVCFQDQVTKEVIQLKLIQLKREYVVQARYKFNVPDIDIQCHCFCGADQVCGTNYENATFSHQIHGKICRYDQPFGAEDQAGQETTCCAVKLSPKREFEALKLSRNRHFVATFQ